MIEPFEPIGVHRARSISHPVEFDEIARHVFLRNNEGDAALGKSVQRLLPTLLGSSVHDIASFRRMEIVALDPRCGRRARLVRVTGDDLAGGCGNTMPGEELDHAMAIRVANCIRRIDYDRARLLRVTKPIKYRSALAHHEYIREMGIELSIRRNELDVEAPRRQSPTDAFQNCAVVVDPSRRVRRFAVNAPTGPSRVHAPPQSPRSRPNSAASAAAMSRALSMSNTQGSTMPQTGWCSATSQPR